VQDLSCAQAPVAFSVGECMQVACGLGWADMDCHTVLYSYQCCDLSYFMIHNTHNFSSLLSKDYMLFPLPPAAPSPTGQLHKLSSTPP
jgi:hypothetical protein